MADVIVEEEAEAELLAASVWYETRSEGLGREFLEEVTRTIATIRSTPALFPPLAELNVEGIVRRALLHRFPYGLIFLERDGAIHVIAAAHARQHRNNWLHRIGMSPK